MSPRRWDFISENRADFGIKRICRVLGVSRSGYYRHQASAEARAERAAEEARTVSEIREIHADHQGAYGAPRVHAELRSRGRKINRKRVTRLMRINRIVGRHLRRKKRTTIADKLDSVGDLEIPRCSGFIKRHARDGSRSMYVARWFMSVRPRPGEQVPSLTAQVARASNPGGTTAMWVRDRLDGLWRDEDFTAWYPRDGRPGLSPAQLATVSVLQFLCNLSDRQAAEAVRCRIDFKYALALPLDDPGFHHSVLSDFRDRLADGGRADLLLDLALRRLREAGLVKERGRQRNDSTHIVAAVRDLTRLELVTEAIRAALEELARTAPQELAGLVTE